MLPSDQLHDILEIVARLHPLTRTRAKSRVMQMPRDCRRAAILQLRRQNMHKLRRTGRIRVYVTAD